MKKSILLLWLSMYTVCFAFGQKQLKKGNDAFKQMEYARAAMHYEELLQQQYISEAAENLAHCYRFLKRVEKAERWYEMVLEEGNEEPLNYLYLAQALLSNNKLAEASAWAARYAEARPEDPRGRYLIKAVEQREEFQNPAQGYTISPCDFNQADYNEFAPAYSHRRLYFTSDRQAHREKGRGASGQSFTRLFQADWPDGEVRPLPGNTNSAFHDGAAAISPDGESMYFTRNYVIKKQKRQGEDHIIHLILAKAKLNGGEWQLDGGFMHNSADYSVAYPTFSRDGNLLVFASDARGGHGGMDLYLCYRSGVDQWSAPQNLGPAVNTPGEEVYPFLMPDGSLVFSSDGLPGLGGQDLFIAKPDGRLWSEARNLGAPLNSPRDEIGFWSFESLQKGWFSSNRNSALALYDVFYFTKDKLPNLLLGMVVDKHTKIPLKGVDIIARDLNSGMEFSTISAEDGQFRFELTAGKPWNISIRGEKNGISTNIEHVVFEPGEEGATNFIQLEHNDPRFTLEGYSLSSKNEKPMEGALVKLLNTNTGKVQTAYSDKDGKFTFQLDQRSDYRITGEKDGYYSTVAEASTKGLDRSTTLYVNLFLYTQVVIINEDITMKDGKNPMSINDIFYDFDDYRIRPDAAKELDKLIAFLQLNKNLEVVQLNAHTDSRGASDYNMNLSQKRAQAAVQYLVAKGIPRNRLRYKGFGESQLVNRCRDGVEDCTEAEHQQNRRTEFRVLSIKR